MGKKKEKKKRLAVDYLKVSKAEKPKEKKSKEEKLKKKARKEEKKKNLKKKPEQIPVQEPVEVPVQEEVIAAVQEPIEVPVQEEVITAAQAAAIFRALGDESRMEILRLLEEKELYGMELLQCMNIVQSTLSHHMRILTETGLVSCRREGKKALYSICPEKMAEAAEFLKHYRGLAKAEKS